MKGGWFKIKNGKLWNKNKLYITLDIKDLHNLSDSGTKPEMRFFINAFNELLARIITQIYAKVSYKENVTRKGAKYGS